MNHTVRMPSPQRLNGFLFAIAAGLLWGFVFVVPLLIPEYPATLQSFGRYLAFGLIALPLAWFDRSQLAGLSKADWIEATKLAFVGNIFYYVLLASAIHRAGGPLPTMIIGALPIAIGIAAKMRTPPPGQVASASVDWAALAPSLLLTAGGIALVNWSEIEEFRRSASADLWSYAFGALLSFGAVACWTWYPLRNADWLRAHANRSARAWATAQGLVCLPMSLAGYLIVWAWLASHGDPFPMPLGPRPGVFVSLMLLVGLTASWLGTMCWNAASQRLPESLTGQLIVIETLAALVYAFAIRQDWPPLPTLAGAVLLVAGVMWAVRAETGHC